ncbi:MAG: M67 family metallopeptidase [Coleofasciculus sp. A1-SPW-01]|uniref:Mov34/MPN/PAD-1 family protein n=1 Tax=Coleofasciculus sp. A1-SPW-01 TaxID=3070819 RepID=UPI0032F985FD
MSNSDHSPTNIVNVNPAQIQAMQTHAENTYPEECCGLLLGHIKGEVKTLVEIIPTKNAWDTQAAEAFQGVNGSPRQSGTKRNQFSIAPEVMLKVQKLSRDRELDIIGIYHSHPDHPAIPSEFDRAIAWQRYSYIIISVQQGIASDLRSWTLDPHHQFQPEEIITVKEPGKGGAEGAM